MRTGSNGQGSNSVHVRQFNERVILSLLRRFGEASKADLARFARLTNNTAGQIVRELESLRLVRVGGKRVNGSRGQPATMLSLDPQGAASLGVEIGRRSVETILVDFTGEILDRVHCERPFPLPEEAVAIACEQIAGVRRSAGTNRPVAGLGVAMPYNMGSWARELDISGAACFAWNDFDIAARLNAETGLRVFVENDGTAAAVAELFCGHGREAEDFLYFFIGPAVGGGLVLEGDFRRGIRGNAGDVGLMPTTPSRLASAPRPAGPFEILLTRASINSLVRHLRALGLPMRDRGELEAAMAAGLPGVMEWVDDCVEALILPILSAVRVLDVPRVVIDGDLPRDLLDQLIERLGAVLEAASPESRDPPELLAGRIGRGAAAFGAAILPLHINYSPSRSILVGQELAV